MAEIERLRYVVTVARAGGISAAARALGVSQPTVSRAVADVERALGAPLFDRRSTGARLVPGAAELLVGIGRIVDGYDELFGTGGSDGPLTIGYAWGGLTPKLERALDAGPSYELRHAVDPVGELVHGRVDRALIRIPSPDVPVPAHTTLLVEESERRVVLVNARHRLADRESVALAELCADSTPVLSEGSGTVPHDLWGAFDGEPVVVPDPLTWLNAIAAASDRFGVTSVSTAEFHIHPRTVYLQCPDLPPVTVRLLGPAPRLR
ncbi:MULTISPECIES: LysR family transcriptional regulator [Gordonia]|uniref:LysR family transcriptional regulator n=1 Tax=Gordonia TaxID=2053 RepID=UPI0030177739